MYNGLSEGECMAEITKKQKKKIKKNVKSTAKRFSTGGIVALVMCFLIGLGGGVFSVFFMTKNDTFTLSGDKKFEYVIGDNDGTVIYTEAGYSVVSFGKNLTDMVKIDTNLEKDNSGNYIIDTSVEGEYYIIYTVDSLKYGKIQRVRSFTVKESADE